VTISETALGELADGTPPHHWFREFRRYLGLASREMRLIRQKITDESRPVDEELSGLPSPISLHADFDTVDEMITSVLVTTPLAPETSQSAGGAGVAPAGPGTVIATLAVANAGVYSVTVNAQVAGAVAGDHNNMGLYVNGVLSTILPVPTAGTAAEQSAPVNLLLPAGATLTVQQIAVTTSTTYYAIITLTDTAASPVTLILGTRTFELPSGVVCLAPLRMLLAKTDQRVLMWTQGGNGALELMGYASGDAG
jgi:hypothetical protein